MYTKAEINRNFTVVKKIFKENLPMKKALSIIITVLLIASIGCNVYLFMTQTSHLN